MNESLSSNGTSIPTYDVQKRQNSRKNINLEILIRIWKFSEHGNSHASSARPPSVALARGHQDDTFASSHTDFHSPLASGIGQFYTSRGLIKRSLAREQLIQKKTFDLSRSSSSSFPSSFFLSPHHHRSTDATRR